MCAPGGPAVLDLVIQTSTSLADGPDLMFAPRDCRLRIPPSSVPAIPGSGVLLCVWPVRLVMQGVWPSFLAAP